MAEEMEKAQKALRDMDYDSMSENGDDEEYGILRKKSCGVVVVSSLSGMVPSRAINNVHSAVDLPSPEVSSASASSLEFFLSSVDTSTNNSTERASISTILNKYDNVLIDTSQPSTQIAKSIPEVTTITSHRTATAHTFPSGRSTISLLPPKNLNGIALIDDNDSTAAFSVELKTFKTDSNQDGTNVYRSNSNDISNNNSGTTHVSAYPGTAGYLEMEEEPPREIYQDHDNKNTDNSSHHIDNTAAFGGESIKTNSGLVLTHRKATNGSPDRNKQHRQTLYRNIFHDAQQNYFEVENGVFRGWNKDNPNFRHRKEGGNFFAGSSGENLGSSNGKHSMVMVQFKRLMSYVKIWVFIFLLVLFAMTGVFFHSMEHQDDLKIVATKTDTISTNSLSSLQSSSIHMNGDANAIAPPPDIALDKILLLPLTDSSQLLSSSLQKQQSYQQLEPNQPRRMKSPQQTFPLNLVDSSRDTRVANDDGGKGASPHHFFRDLRQEFQDWMQHHGKVYRSKDEMEHRFSIWSQNHLRTAEKNTQHGPCTLTKQHVFGSNQFKDLAPEEFKMKFLTGYKGEYKDVLEKKQQELSPDLRQLRKDSGIGLVLDPKIHEVKIHESVLEKQRHLQQSSSRYKPQVIGSSSMSCKWYDLSCILRYVWQSTGIQFGSLVGTMEPKYDADAFPNSVDWRDSGSVTNIRTQGECGACWAVTAVETVESAYFLATGTLYELSESEIIVCDDSCEMCSGGWPQNAFEWVMDHGGLPLQNTLPYDAYTLIALTAGLEGESQYYDENTVESYRAEVCPADDNSGSNSNDNSYWEDGMENENYGDYSDQGRYGNIKGYGYATDRCLCYTDGSGCDCEDQDEDTAVRNIATYGPAAVCLEASTWQDYAGGVMTSSIGCGQEFLDMNHCVQVVGYAFTTSGNCNDEADCSGSQDDESGSNSDSRSGDSSDREGYWIVRNQWGENWGMNGYAYVSMGANTCGILNDMTIAYV